MKEYIKLEDYSNKEQYDNAIESAKLLAEYNTLQDIRDKVTKSPRNTIYLYALEMKLVR